MINWIRKKTVYKRRKAKIPLDLPPEMLLFTRSDRERIDAIIDREQRVRRMVVHTRSG